jgi:hypothetical protein
LAAGAPWRVAARGGWDVRRRLPAEVFLVRRVTAVVFFDRWRVFPATAFAWISRPELRVSRMTRKITLPTGERLGCGALLIFLTYSTFFAEIKGLWRCKNAAKGQFPSFQHYNFVIVG